jgi:hypothetical protein
MSITASTDRFFPVFAGLLVACVFQLVGCASSGDSAKQIEHPNPVLPEWVSSPYLEGSMVQTACVEDNAPMSILKGKAALLARASLASELKVGLQDLKDNYQESDATDVGATFSEDYDRTSEALQKETLTGSREARADYVTADGKKEFCVMVVIDKTNTDRLKEGVFSRTGIDATADQKNQLWQEFLLKQTRESLEAERG